jgi:hypothetical protein
MPTVLRKDGFRVYFFSHEPGEPPHVHLDRGGASAKVWLEPVGLARNVGFSPHELRGILKMVADHRQQLLEAWDEYFGRRG